jgi:hypothetical protein
MSCSFYASHIDFTVVSLTSLAIVSMLDFSFSTSTGTDERVNKYTDAFYFLLGFMSYATGGLFSCFILPLLLLLLVASSLSICLYAS